MSRPTDAGQPEDHREPFSGPFAEIAALDRLLHEPARLAILTALSACDGADFLFLQRLTGLTKGNLSSHLTRLDKAGLLRVEKRFKGRTPQTLAILTTQGREAVERHWQRLERLRRDAQIWATRDPDA